MKVLFVTSEAAPFVKTGGLGDVAGSLPPALKQKGVDARVIMPLYGCIAQEYKDQMRYINHIYIDMAWRKQYCGVFELEYEGTTFYFIDNLFYFNSSQPYGYIHEDCEKFLFFSKAVISLLPTIEFRPDVIHCNDWQSGGVPVFLDTCLNNPFYRGIKTLMTIHNLRFQGRWDFKGIKDVMGISDYYFTSDKLEYHKDANILKGGMVYANKISTVSETYANEITTAEYGEGLDGLLRARRNDLCGIVNGISYSTWNPETDNKIFHNYNRNNAWEQKKINKLRLQEQCNLPVDENKFMIGIVSRLTDQKGFDLVSYVLDTLCSENVQIVLLGTGDEKYENLFRHYAWKYPDKISSNIYFSDDLSHKIYAAADVFLMPSRFEPCGLSQLISMRYGTLPIVRETGGLKDTVSPYNEYTGGGTGFSFGNYSAHDMLYVIHYAMNVFYNNREAWNTIMYNAMSADYSWNRSADRYIDLYQSMTGIYDLPEKKTNEPEAVEQQAAEPEKEKKAAPKKKAAKKQTAKKTAEKKTTAKADTKTTKKTKTAGSKEKTVSEEKTAAKPAKKSEKVTAAKTKPAETEIKAEVKEEAVKQEKSVSKSAAKTESVKTEKAAVKKADDKAENAPAKEESVKTEKTASKKTTAAKKTPSSDKKTAPKKSVVKGNKKTTDK
jgi:starch synthase